ncbi:hypothetical protein ACJX0J_016673, partial [Zea mays]
TFPPSSGWGMPKKKEEGKKDDKEDQLMTTRLDEGARGAKKKRVMQQDDEDIKTKSKELEQARTVLEKNSDRFYRECNHVRAKHFW